MAKVTIKNHEGTVIDSNEMPNAVTIMSIMFRCGYEFVSASNDNEITLVNMANETARFIIFKD